MNPTAHFERNDFRSGSGTRLGHITVLLMAWTTGQIFGQSSNISAPISAACIELNQLAMTQVASGKLKEAELALTAFLTSGADQARGACTGLVLNNLAAFMSISGRNGDGARLAEQSVHTLERVYSPNHPALLRPLQILAATSFEQGMMGKAREAFKRMQSIRIQRPEDRALLHGMAAVFSETEGRLPEAEADYLAALQAWQEAGKGQGADAGVILYGLGSLYIKEDRLSEARQALDRALAIFDSVKDAVSMDRIKLLYIRGVLQARQGDWQGAEQNLHEALTVADRELWVDPFTLRELLKNYAVVLRRNNRRREARSIEARGAAIQVDGRRATIVDVTELLPKAKPVKK
jgi:tetratricopeptide (TPR) repeat protein